VLELLLLLLYIRDMGVIGHPNDVSNAAFTTRSD